MRNPLQVRYFLTITEEVRAPPTSHRRPHERGRPGLSFGTRVAVDDALGAQVGCPKYGRTTSAKTPSGQSPCRLLATASPMTEAQVDRLRAIRKALVDLAISVDPITGR